MRIVSKKIIFLILLALCLCISDTLPIVGVLPNKTFQLQLGQHYSYEIPQYFSTYQHGKITNFTHQNTKLSIKFCSISILQQSNYKSQDIVFHFQYSNPSPQYFGDKVIYNFQDLIQMNQVIDSIEFNGKIIVLFQTKHYVVYSIQENGKIKTEKHTQSILSKFAGLSYGNFIRNGQHLLFFSENQLFYFNAQQNKFEPVTNYDPIGYQFQSATMYNNTIYVAAGEKGIFIYSFNDQTKTIYKKFQFNITEGQDSYKYTLNPSDIQYDQISDLIYIIDSQEGIRWFKVPTDDTLTELFVQPSNIYVQNCQNLHLTNQYLFATCPSILKVALTNKSDIEIGPTVGFYPTQMILNNSRVILLGENKYAIWDTEGGSIQSGFDDHLISNAFVHDQWIILVNQFDISVGSIIPSSEEMYCQLDKTDQIVGNNQFNISLQGICSQLLVSNASNLLNKVQTGNCIIQQPIKIIVHDSKIFNFLIQIVLIGVLVWCITVGTIYYCVKDYKVRKGYQNLPEQRTGMDEGKNQEVMSSKSQQFQNK